MIVRQERKRTWLENCGLGAADGFADAGRRVHVERVRLFCFKEVLDFRSLVTYSSTAVDESYHHNTVIMIAELT